MASRRTRSSTKADIQSGNQRTLFDLVGGKPRGEVLAHEAVVSTPSAPVVAAGLPHSIEQSDPKEPSLGESSSASAVRELHDKPLRRKRSSRKVGVPQAPSGSVYSIFKSPSASTASGQASAFATNSQTSAPLKRLDTDGPCFHASRPSATEEVTPPEQGSSRDDAILISSSPVRPIRAPRAIRVEKARKTHAGNTNEHDWIPYPSDSHIHGPQEDFSHPRSIPFSRRLRQCHSQAGRSNEPTMSGFEEQREASYHAMPALRHEVTQEATTEADMLSHVPIAVAIEELRRDSAQHPAIERLLNSVGLPNKEPLAEDVMWSEKWRPSAANQVLGNESSARYLRDWLATLQLGQASFSSTTEPATSAKRKRQPTLPTKPVVMRAVDRAGRRKRAKLDSDDDEDMGWIAEDEESDEPIEDDGTEDELLLRGQRQATPIINSDTKIEMAEERISFEVLTNTILISGPTGVGKTAAVFACAAELGYEVFEVYPGIGRRSGAELDRLIGDVGKNHLVNKSDAAPKIHQLKPANGTSNSVFGTFTRKSPGISNLGAVETTSNTDRHTPSHEEVHHTSVSSVGQSFVLLEEVDILFRDDTNFWPSVVNIIKECRRPVVLTCNDPALVPIEDLPLQAILEFQPCLTSHASCLLQAIAFAGRKSITRQDAGHIYDNTRSSIPGNLPDIPLHPFTQYPLHSDLRLAINTLEYLSKSDRDLHLLHQHPSAASAVSTQPLPDTKEQIRQLIHLSMHTNNMSLADFVLERRIGSEEEEHMIREHDEIGSVVAYGDSIQHPWPHSLATFYTHDQIIFREVVDMSQRALSQHVIGHASAPVAEALNGFTTFRARADYQGHMVAVLGDLLSISSPLLPRPAVFVDYDAWIRIMVRQDDELEALGNRETSRAVEPLRRGRITRNSQKYTRWLSISDEHRQTLKATSLSWE